MRGWIEHVAALAGYCTGRSARRRDGTLLRNGARLRTSGRGAGAQLLEAVFAVVLHALQPHFELLVLVLELLDGAGELAQRALDAVDARGIAIAGLRHRRRWARGFRRRAGLALLGRLFAALEQIVEEAAALSVLRHGSAGEQQQWQRRERSDTGTIS